MHPTRLCAPQFSGKFEVFDRSTPKVHEKALKIATQIQKNPPIRQIALENTDHFGHKLAFSTTYDDLDDRIRNQLNQAGIVFFYKESGLLRPTPQKQHRATPSAWIAKIREFLGKG